MKTLTLSFIGCILALNATAQLGYGISSAAYATNHGGREVMKPNEIVEEEIFNFHDHNIETASYNDPVKLSHAWGNSKVNKGTEALILQIGLATNRSRNLENIPPANLSLVVDVSGSMGGSPLAKSKEAMRELVKQLRPSDHVSLVLFGSSVTVPYSSKKIGDKTELLEAIDNISINGSTNVHLGMKKGYEEVASTYLHNGSNRVIVFTDAMANTGLLNPDDILNDTKVYIRDIELTFIGIGMAFNQDFARQIKTRLRGHMHFVGNAGEIDKIFKEEVEQFLTKPFGKNATLTVNIPKGFSLEQFYGYQPTIANNQITVNVDDMQGGLTQIFMLKLKGNTDRKQIPSISYTLTYTDQNGQEMSVSNEANDLEFVPNQFTYDKLANQVVKKNYTIVYMANELKKALIEYDKETNLKNYNERLKSVLSEVEQEFPTRDADIEYVYELLRKQILPEPETENKGDTISLKIPPMEGNR